MDLILEPEAEQDLKQLDTGTSKIHSRSPQRIRKESYMSPGFRYNKDQRPHSLQICDERRKSERR